MKNTGNEPLLFAVLTDTHISPARTAAVEQLGRTYAALAGMGDQDGYVYGIRLRDTTDRSAENDL